MVLTNMDEIIQQYFKTGLCYNEILSVLTGHHNVILSICQLKRIQKNSLSKKNAKKLHQQCPCVCNKFNKSLLPDV